MGENRIQTESKQTNVLVLVKKNRTERFIFLFDDESIDELSNVLVRYALDPELEFSWYDAVVLSQRARMFVNNK